MRPTPITPTRTRSFAPSTRREDAAVAIPATAFKNVRRGCT